MDVSVVNLDPEVDVDTDVEVDMDVDVAGVEVEVGKQTLARIPASLGL